MDELIRKVARAKSIIDNGFSRVGSGFKKDQKTDEALVGGACRAVSLSDAVVVLCKNNHAQEAIFVLRALAATALSMRWVAGVPLGAKDAAVLQEAFWDLDWNQVWSDTAWKTRLRKAGVTAEELKSLGMLLTSGDYRHMCPTVFNVPWAHIFSEHPHSAPPAEEILKAAISALSHVVKALEARWPKAFPGAEELC